MTHIFHSVYTKAFISTSTTKCLQQGEHNLFTSKCKRYVHMHTHQEGLITLSVTRNSNNSSYLNPRSIYSLRSIFYPWKDTLGLRGFPRFIQALQ